MSFRGVTKAIYRTPHQFFGTKSSEDELISQWEHDIKTAVAGLEFLQSQQKKWKTTWSTLLENYLDIVDSFSLFHKPMDRLDEYFVADENESDNMKLKKRDTEPDEQVILDDNEQFTNITTHELKQSKRLFLMICSKVNNKVEVSQKKIDQHCEEMKTHLNNVLRLITKRNHKKTDYDMSHNSVQKMLGTAQPERSRLEQGKHELDETTRVYNDLNQKVKMILPQVMSTLSEFLNKLTLKAYYQNIEVYKTFVHNIHRYAVLQGLLSTKLSELTYEQLISEFHEQYILAENGISELELLKQHKQDVKEKTVQAMSSGASTVMETTASLTGTLYTKAVNRNQKLNFRTMTIENPVKPYSKDGMFSGRAVNDPIKMIISDMYDKEMSELTEQEMKDADEYQSHIETPAPAPEQLNSPVCFGFPDTFPPISHSGSIQQESIHDSPIAINEEELTWMKPLSLKKSREPDNEPQFQSLDFALSSKADSADGTDASTDKSPSILSPNEAALASGATTPLNSPSPPLKKGRRSAAASNNKRHSRLLSWTTSISVPTRSASQTEKYLKISNDEVKARISDNITKPKIVDVPVTSPLIFEEFAGKFVDPVKMESSITVNLFRQRNHFKKSSVPVA
ncbi:unnamed protein product [Ambrosiozyma monospora]|uniref:Unnamed protein product n=1 Tax=Ambrosiozyma monospora TaxID=43982 RepID=A0ACB5SVM9_AMBMO|nr:unnamed protein product [Ambrosiozyma monospora]